MQVAPWARIAWSWWGVAPLSVVHHFACTLSEKGESGEINAAAAPSVARDLRGTVHGGGGRLFALFRPDAFLGRSSARFIKMARAE